jgi:putative phosphoribosyl transferase
VAASEACDSIQSEVDEIVCVATPEPFNGVSRWYENFPQVTDDEVRILLEQANRQLLYR